jgi:hypothetical protein
MLTWLLELFLSSIPSWAWLASGVAALVIFLLSGILSHVPSLGIYAKLIKPVSGIVTLVCVFMYGGAGVQAMWEEKVRLAQEEADRKAAMALQLNKDLDVERKKKQKVRVEYYATVKTEIKEVEKLIDAKCEIDPKVPELLNKAAQNPEKAK